MKNNFDYIIIGSGLAGLTTGLTLGNSGNVAILTKKNLSDSATNLAQGGMATMIDKGDRIDWHVEDTIKAGDYHNKKEAVDLLVNNSREAFLWLKDCGVSFDPKPSLEAGHRRPRIFHTTDFTGQDIISTLLKRVKMNKQVNIFEDTLVIDLIVKKNVCLGVFVLTKDNQIIPFFAKAIILATGGSGQVYQWTTNPSVATGDGLAMAQRAGADIADVEFVQFHPTAFKSKTSPLFLLSERLRGEGAKLIDEKGNRFAEELISRNRLSRAVYEKQKDSKVYLTIAHIDKKEITNKFPNIYKRLKSYGLDLTKEPIPVTLAAHYQCGGITTDLSGRTSINNLFAVGEVANTGVHGANRLASNSLLEAVVFGKQVGNYIKKHYSVIPAKAGIQTKITSLKCNYRIDPRLHGDDTSNIKREIQKTMWKKVSIVRHKNELLTALNIFENYKKQINKMKKDIGISRQLLEVANLIEVAILITKAAIARPKSLGAHFIKL